MNILWVKDGKIGHEKQVKALLDELAKTIDIKVYEEEYIIGPFQRINDILYYASRSNELMHHAKYHKKNIHLIIGAGSNTHARVLQIKRGLKHDFHKEVLAVSLLVPSFFKKHFDLICAPKHDQHKLSGHEAIYFE